MKRILTLALAATLAAFGAQASAIKFKPGHLPPAKPMEQRAAGKAFAGTWLATYDGGAHQSFMQWRPDGTASQNTDLPTANGNVMMGDWSAVDNKTASAYLISWNYDDTGTLTGYFVKKETAKVKGASYSGTFEITFYDLAGNLLFDHSGAVTAVRLTEE
jgi:hypothetical protein